MLEQQKFRTLGQLQILRSLHTAFIDSDRNPQVLSGDRFYALVYSYMTNLYKCQLD